MNHKKFKLCLALASAATLAAALLAPAPVGADDGSASDWASNREIGVYDPSIPDIEDDDTIFDEVQPFIPQTPPPYPNQYTGPKYIFENGSRIRNRVVFYEGQFYSTGRHGDAGRITDDPAEQIPNDLKNSFYTSPTGNLYYFDENGRRVVNFYNIDGKQYFFDDHGRQVRNRFVDYYFTYYIGDDGQPYKDGVYKIGNYYYAFGSDATLLREGVIDYEGYRYYSNWYGVVDISKGRAINNANNP